MFPYYLTIGMTYDQFWRDDPELVKYYREAFSLKQQLREQELWIQGAYICEAIGAVFSDKKKKVNYPQQPRGYLGKQKKKENKEAEEQQDKEKVKAALQAWAMAVNKKFRKKGGEETGR